MRAILVEIIYRRTFVTSPAAPQNSDAVTLMSTDVERITTGLRTFPEMWASIVIIALAIRLLQGKLDVDVLGPSAVVLLCTGLAAWVASGAGVAQKSWLDRIQSRVSATADLLGMTKVIKMTGMTDALRDKIRELREEEIQASCTSRFVLVKLVTLSHMSEAMNPVTAFGVYILLQLIAR